MVPIALRRKSQQSQETGAGLVLPSTDPEGAAPAGVDAGSTAAPLADVGPITTKVAERPTIDRPLGEILVTRKLITPEQLEAALAVQADEPDVKLGRILVDQKAITDRILSQVVSEQRGLELADLRHLSPAPEAIAALPEEVARANSALPLASTDDGLKVVVPDPLLPGLAQLLADAAGEPVRLVIAARDDIEKAIDRVYRAVTGLDEFVKVFEAGRALTQPTAEGAEVAVDVDENAPIVQVINRILSQAIRDRASDVHIEPMPDRVRVRNRVDGALHEVLSLPQTMAMALASRVKIMADLNIVERRRPQDGQIEAVVEGVPIDIRVSTTSTVHGEKVVLRILDKQKALYDIADLGMPADTAVRYREVIRSPYGMVVCAGPTGSGKTTTLYATLSEINSEEINVMTVEDPVEYVMPTVNQISINEQAGVTFAAGLRSILRQDPDAILVGEIRDIETARIAIQAALTGHFVMSTIHATDSTSALHRFLDMGIESFLLASSMLAVVGQRLVRRICSECAVPYQPAPEELDFYARFSDKGKTDFVKGEGCTFCAGTGYQGRVGVYEVLMVTDGMKDLLVRNAPVDEMRELAHDEGMVSMREQAGRLIDDDVTTIAEVLRTIYIL